MGVRLIPSDPPFRNESERRVWKALKAKLPDGAFLAANVALQTHADFYEADLVVGLPGAGFAVIEVKGGPVRHTDEGWLQETGHGPKRIDPAGQADRAKRLLDGYVRDRGWAHGPLRFEHLVAFPGTDFEPGTPPSPDLARWALIARNDLERAADLVFEALNKRASEMPRPSAPWVDEVADLLGGRPDPARALLDRDRARSDHVEQLTAQQCTLLDHFVDNDRIRVLGGPGTGKTWVALEQARRWAAAGEQVLLVVYSRGLARWLAQAVAVMPEKQARRITVRSFHAYGVGLGIDVPDGADQHWWDVALPGLMAAHVVPAYDALVVDEAQDFADAWWPPLLASLRGRHMLVAGDDQQTVFTGRAGKPPVEMAAMRLDENLRNTTQIASVFNPMAEKRMTFRGGEGPPVRFVPCASTDACAAADTVVEQLLEAGCDAGSIAVLTTGHRHPDHRRVEEAVGKDGYWDGFWESDEVFHGTVMGFKGLERPVVVLAVDGFHDGVARDVMYAGLSRARDELVVCGDLAVIRAAAGDEVAKRLSAG